MRLICCYLLLCVCAVSSILALFDSPELKSSDVSTPPEPLALPAAVAITATAAPISPFPTDRVLSDSDWEFNIPRPNATQPVSTLSLPVAPIPKPSFPVPTHPVAARPVNRPLPTAALSDTDLDALLAQVSDSSAAALAVAGGIVSADAMDSKHSKSSAASAAMKCDDDDVPLAAFAANTSPPPRPAASARSVGLSAKSLVRSKPVAASTAPNGFVTPRSNRPAPSPTSPKRFASAAAAVDGDDDFEADARDHKKSSPLRPSPNAVRATTQRSPNRLHFTPTSDGSNRRSNPISRIRLPDSFPTLAAYQAAFIEALCEQLQVKLQRAADSFHAAFQSFARFATSGPNGIRTKSGTREHAPPSDARLISFLLWFCAVDAPSSAQNKTFFRDKRLAYYLKESVVCYERFSPDRPIAGGDTRLLRLLGTVRHLG